MTRRSSGRPSHMPRKPLLLETLVTVEPAIGADGARRYAVKLQAAAFEVNVWVRPEDVAKFEQVRASRWRSGAVRIGEAAGAGAFWCAGGDDEGDDSVSLLIGHDDETWDVALSLPPDALVTIMRELAACRAGDGGV